MFGCSRRRGVSVKLSPFRPERRASIIWCVNGKLRGDSPCVAGESHPRSHFFNNFRRRSKGQAVVTPLTEFARQWLGCASDSAGFGVRGAGSWRAELWAGTRWAYMCGLSTIPEPDRFRKAGHDAKKRPGAWPGPVQQGGACDDPHMPRELLRDLTDGRSPIRKARSEYHQVQCQPMGEQTKIGGKPL